jgi:hypothetical protein
LNDLEFQSGTDGLLFLFVQHVIDSRGRKGSDIPKLGQSVPAMDSITAGRRTL